MANPRSSNRQKSPVSDPVVGEWRFSENLRAWAAISSIPGYPFGFVVAGESVPCEAVVAHVHSILRNFAEFRKSLEAFLELEAAVYPGLAQEIGQLRPVHISLPFSDRPADGEIGFDGPSDVRVWHCSYLEGKPRHLTFDD